MRVVKHIPVGGVHFYSASANPDKGPHATPFERAHLTVDLGIDLPGEGYVLGSNWLRRFVRPDFSERLAQSKGDRAEDHDFGKLGERVEWYCFHLQTAEVEVAQGGRETNRLSRIPSNPIDSLYLPDPRVSQFGRLGSGRSDCLVIR